jgi:hypothetical protein
MPSLATKCSKIFRTEAFALSFDALAAVKTGIGGSVRSSLLYVAGTFNHRRKHFGLCFFPAPTPRVVLLHPDDW